MTRRERFFAVLLGLGMVFGIGLEVARASRGMRHRRAAFEDHVAQKCVEAAERARSR